MSDGNILPLVDRRTPLLDRVRDDKDEEGELAEDVGKEIAGAILSDDETDTEKAKEDVKESFRKGMAEKFGISPDAIEEDAADGLAGLLDLKVEDVVTEDALVSLGITDEVEGESEDEEEESPLSSLAE